MRNAECNLIADVSGRRNVPCIVYHNESGGIVDTTFM